MIDDVVDELILVVLTLAYADTACADLWTQVTMAALLCCCL